VTDNAPITKLLYTPNEAAEALGIGRSSLSVLLAQGAIRSIRIGGSRRIPAGALTAFITALADESTVAANHYHPGAVTPRNRD
jgi:excisionase family DNA binding protein